MDPAETAPARSYLRVATLAGGAGLARFATSGSPCSSHLVGTHYPADIAGGLLLGPTFVYFTVSAARWARESQPHVAVSRESE